MRSRVPVSVGQLEYLEWGARSSSPSILLLHGFPQPPETWSAIGTQLAAEGHHVIALQQRGYSTDACPPKARYYSLLDLAGDVAEAMVGLDIEAAHVVGHDWGAAVAWVAAAYNPDKVLSLVALSMPHPATFLRAMVTTKQPIKSWYMGVFSLPKIPELIVGFRKGEFAAQWLASTGLALDQAREYIAYLREDPRRVRGALNWYRAIPQNAALVLHPRSVQVPTLLVWSSGDVAVDGKAVRLSRHYVSGRYEFREMQGANHWLPEQHPLALAEMIHAHAASI